MRRTKRCVKLLKVVGFGSLGSSRSLIKATSFSSFSRKESLLAWNLADMDFNLSLLGSC